MLLETIKLMAIILFSYGIFVEAVIPALRGKPLFPLFRDETKLWMDENGLSPQQEEENKSVE